MHNDPAMGEPKKRITRMRYGVGPMGFLSDQIMKEMQRAHYPAKEYNLYRSPEAQAALSSTVTNAGAYPSGHQYYGASDIIHDRWAWFEGKPEGYGDQFWERLWDCVEVVSEKYSVEFSKRLEWDLAHVELANWREFKRVVGLQKPNQTQLDWYFQHTLPGVWKQHQRSKQRAA